MMIFTPLVDAVRQRRLGYRSERSRRGVPTLLTIALLLVPLALGGCASGGMWGPRYTPANAAIDPYATMRGRAEELYQEGLARERRKEWREAARSYEQARLWDPDNRTDIATSLVRARAASGQAVLAATPPALAVSPGTLPTPTGTVPSGYRLFRSKVAPYTIAYPADWTPKPGSPEQGREAADLFVAPAGRAQAAVTITTQALRNDVTLDQYCLLTAKQLEDAGASIIERESRSLDGRLACALSYRLRSGADYLAVRHLLFIDGNRGWGVLLMATPGTTPELLKIYDAMVGSLDIQLAPGSVQ